MIVTNVLDNKKGFGTWTIQYEGKIVSLNDYKSKGWRDLKRMIDSVKWESISLIRKAQIPPLKYMELRVFHNTKFDMDNLAGLIKPFVDCLRSEKVLVDDTKQQWDYLSIQYSPKLKKNCVQFQITGEIK